MNEQEFQLELERFKQKANWERMVFYFVMSGLWGRILLFFDKGNVDNIIFLLWLSSLGIFLMIGELLVHKYLDKQMEKIKNKIRRLK